jgi:hypothetical protein
MWHSGDFEWVTEEEFGISWDVYGRYGGHNSGSCRIPAGALDDETHETFIFNLIDEEVIMQRRSLAAKKRSGTAAKKRKIRELQKELKDLKRNY